MEPPVARLEVVSGKGAGMAIEVVDELLIGRNAEGAGRLADDEEISRTHARVSVDGDGHCTIEDLGSTNGTFVNRRRISEPQRLAVGDMVELGGTLLVVRDLPQPVVSETVARQVPLEAQPSQPSSAQTSAVQPVESVTVEPTVIGASVATAPAADPEAPTELDVADPAPPSTPEPVQAAGPDPAPPSTPEPVQSAVTDPAPAPVAAPSAQADVPDRAPIPPPPSLHLEVDFDAGEVRLTPVDGAEPITLVYRDGGWRPVTPS